MDLFRSENPVINIYNNVQIVHAVVVVVYIHFTSLVCVRNISVFMDLFSTLTCHYDEYFLYA